MKQRVHPIPNISLRTQRERRHWTQTELARMLGTTYLSVCRWENGTTAPSLYFRKRLCEVFGLPPEELGLTPPSKEISRDMASPPLTPAFWTIPYRRNPFFTGREHILLGLHTLLHAGKRAALVQAQAISGLGGIGKTQTAIEYAYRFREHYQTILWCRAETRNVLLADLVALAYKLDLHEKDEQDQERVVQAVRQWLQNSTGWLLILDNVEDLSLVEDVLPSEYSGHVLLTTRTQSTGTFAQRIDLEPMEPEEGALFLLRRAKLIRPDAPLEALPSAEQARELSRLLDGLPLALDQAGAYIEETGCSLADYLQRYQTRRASLLHRRGGPGTEHLESVGTTISLALGRVERANPAAAELLRFCAFLDPDAIAEEIITAESADLGPVLAAVAADPVALDAALADLRRYSLLRRNPESKTLTIHRLVQAVLKDQMDEQNQQQWAERCVRALSRILPTHEATLWQHGQRFFPQALMAVELIAHWQLSFLEAGQVLVHAGNYLMQRGQYQEAEPLLKQALAICEQCKGPGGPARLALAACLDKLGELYWHQSSFERAEPLRKRALEVWEQAWGPEHPEVAQGLNNLALVYREQGRLALAEPLFVRAHGFYEQLARTRPLSQALCYDFAACSGNLGILCTLQGNFARAEPLLLQALRLTEQAVGAHHPDTSYGYHNLGFLYEWQGCYAQAEEWYQRALTLREEMFGVEHPNTAFTLHNLARVYQKQGSYTRAESLFQRALSIREKILGTAHPHVANTLNRLALLYHAQGKTTQAEPLLLRALAIREHALGPGHPEVGWDLEALAQVYEALGRYGEAEPLAQRALSIYEPQLGADHPDSIESFAILGILCSKQGRYEEAEQFLQHALAICEQRWGREHPDTARSLHSLAELYELQGRYIEAEPLFQRALAIRERKLGAEHPDTLATRERYAELLVNMKQEG